MNSEKGKCKRPGCNNQIPSRRINYCSKTCYDMEKCRRQKNKNKKMKQFENEIKRNDQILKTCWTMLQLNKEVYFNDLEKLNFNWALSLGQIQKNGVIWTRINEYAYYIQPKNKSVDICKVEINL